MALKAILDSLDGLSDAVKGEYEEFDADDAGTKKFRLSVEGADSLVDNSGIKNALEKERTKARLVDAIRKEFPGATDDEIRELVKKAKEMKGKGGKGDGEQPDTEKLVAKLRKEIDEEYAPIKLENETLKSKVRRVLLDDQVRKEAVDAGIIGDDIEDVLELTRKHFDLDEKDRVIVLDEDGDPSSVTLKKFFTDVFKKRKPKFYKAPEASGGDATGTRKPSKTSESDDLAKLPPGQRLAEFRRREAAKKKT